MPPCLVYGQSPVVLGTTPGSSEVTIVCYARGTRIGTPAGQRPPVRSVRSHGLSCTNRPFEFALGLQAFPVTADRRNGKFPAVVPEADRAIESGRIAI